MKAVQLSGPEFAEDEEDTKASRPWPLVTGAAPKIFWCSLCAEKSLLRVF
jgi:hypothetical protein